MTENRSAKNFCPELHPYVVVYLAQKILSPDPYLKISTFPDRLLLESNRGKIIPQRRRGAEEEGKSVSFSAHTCRDLASHLKSLAPAKEVNEAGSSDLKPSPPLYAPAFACPAVASQPLRRRGNHHLCFRLIQSPHSRSTLNRPGPISSRERNRDPSSIA